MKTPLHIVSLLLLITAPIFAQSPQITSLSVTNNDILTVYGKVGLNPKIFIDSVSIPVSKVDTNYCTCTIPGTGRGSEGYVYFESNGNRSNSKLLTKWDVTVDYWRGCDYTDHFRWWYDLYSFLKGPKNEVQIKSDPATITLTPITNIGTPDYPYYSCIVQGIPIGVNLNPNLAIGGNGTEGRIPCDITISGESKYLPPLDACLLLISPKLLSPANTSIQSGDSLTFSWRKGPSVIIYELQVASNPSFASKSILLQVDIPDTTYRWWNWKVSPAIYWRVRGINAEGVTVPSEVWSYVPDTTKSEVNSKENEAALFTCSVDPSAMVLYLNSTETLDAVTIYDMLGRKIKTIDSYRSARGGETESYQTSVKNFPSGIYFVKAYHGSKIFSGSFSR
ncbi:MAG: T9SS type A sorting domain-containing protein [Ignavibacteriota bacterium]